MSKEIDWKVKGMCCNNCVHHVERTMKLMGIEDSHVEVGRVACHLPDHISEQELSERICDCGYQVVGARKASLADRVFRRSRK